MVIHQRSGSLMLGLMAAIMLVGVVSVNLIPSQDIQETRKREEDLRQTLARIRMAFDLMAVSNPNYDPDLTDAAKVKAALKELRDKNLLGNSGTVDRTLQNQIWDSALGQYWVGVPNIASNPAFEITDTSTGFIASWTRGTADSDVTTESVAFPSALDDFQGQNKFGKRFTFTNVTVKITK